MLKQIVRNKAIVLLCLLCALCSTEAYARGGGGHHNGRHRSDYHYRDGRWYRPGWLGFDIAVTALAIGAIVDAIPPRYNTVVVGGVPYYYFDGYYYRPCPAGYVVVPPPVVTQPIVVAPQVISSAVQVAAPMQTTGSQTHISDTVTINIPNGKGSYTAVTLKRAGNGFVGPQGEFYTEHPTVEQLKTLYGG